MNNCPCCSQLMLRHARHNRVYWFCTHCWQEMPNFSTIALTEHTTSRSLGNVSPSSLVAPKRLIEIF